MRQTELLTQADGCVGLRGEGELHVVQPAWYYNLQSGEQESPLGYVLQCLLESRMRLGQSSVLPEEEEVNVYLGHLLLEVMTPAYRELHDRYVAETPVEVFHKVEHVREPAHKFLVYRANAVPVGEDQVSHIELTREIARRFNYLFGEVFPEPQALLTKVPKLPGTDGRKMSKSYGNSIALTEKPDVVKQTLRNMVTDPARKRRTDPGNPDVCPVGDYHKVFSGPGKNSEVDQGCRSAGIGCIECKMWLFDSLQQKLGPIYERRQALEGRKDDVTSILEDGASKAKAAADATLGLVREAMKI